MSAPRRRSRRYPRTTLSARGRKWCVRRRDKHPAPPPLVILRSTLPDRASHSESVASSTFPGITIVARRPMTLCFCYQVTEPAAFSPHRPAAPQTLPQSRPQSSFRKKGGSLVRGIAVDLPPVSWADIGGLDAVKLQLQRAVEWPLARADDLKYLNLRPPRGILLHGPNAPPASLTLSNSARQELI